MALSIYDIARLTAGHVLPVLPSALAQAQLQGQAAKLAQIGDPGEVGFIPAAGDNSLNNEPALNNDGHVEGLKFSMFGTPMVQPLEVSINGETDFWLLPIEPIITIGGGNVIAKRNVAKSKYRGTIKERWSQDDYTITINGIFRSENKNTYPENDVKKLRDICEARQVIYVRCPLFQIFNISQIVVEKYDFPFTKGDDMQAYNLAGLSDDNYQLLIEIE